MGSRRRNALRHESGAVEVDNEWWHVSGSNGSASFSRPEPVSDGRELHRELLGGRNTASKLMCREIGQLRGRMPPRPDVHFCTEKFRRFKLQEQFFVHDGIEHTSGTMTTAISITGIVAANDFIFVVAACGVCIAFRQTKNGSNTPYRRDGQIWYFNNLDECVERVFYNKINDSIVTVSSTRRGNGYATRALPLESIRRCNHSDNGVQIFGVSLGIPDFFYDSNIAVVPYRIYVDNVHEMNDYNLVHSFRSKNILSVRPSRPGILIVAFMLTGTYCITIEVLSTENWVVLKKVNYAVPPSGFDLVSIYQDNILLKEKGKAMRMINILNDGSVNLIKHTNKHQELLVVYELTAKRLLLRYNKNTVVASCNPHDNQVALLEDNEVPSDCNDDGHLNSDTYVTMDKSYAMIYSRKYIEKPRQGINTSQEFSCIGSINVCNTFNGESVWKINPSDDVDLAIATRLEGSNNMTNIRTIIHEALHDVTALFYDEEQHRIYTGNKRGFFHVWSN